MTNLKQLQESIQEKISMLKEQEPCPNSEVIHPILSPFPILVDLELLRLKKLKSDPSFVAQTHL